MWGVGPIIDSESIQIFVLAHKNVFFRSEEWYFFQTLDFFEGRNCTFLQHLQIRRILRWEEWYFFTTFDFIEEKTREGIESKFQQGLRLLTSIGNGQTLGPGGIKLEFRNGNRKISPDHTLEFQFLEGEEIIQCIVLNEDILRLEAKRKKEIELIILLMQSSFIVKLINTCSQITLMVSR